MVYSIILGGGVAGLAAARELLKQGETKLIVIEQQPHLGGLSATMQWGQTRIDYGPHRISTDLPEVEALIKEVCGDHLLTRSRTSRMLIQGKWLDYPPTPIQLLQQLGIGETALLGGSLLTARARAFIRRWRKSFQPTNYQELMNQTFGQRLTRQMLSPMAAKVWRLDPSELDPQVARIRISQTNPLQILSSLITRSDQLARKQFLYPQGGIGRISHTLGEQIQQLGGEVWLEADPVAIRCENHQLTEITVRQKNNETSIPIKQLISTIPVRRLARLLPPKHSENIEDDLPWLQTSNEVLVYFLLDKQPAYSSTWMYFPDVNLAFTRSCEAYHFDPNNVPIGQSVVCIELPCLASEPIWTMESQDLIQRLWTQWSRIGLAEGVDLLDATVIRLEDVYPVYRLGYRQHWSAIKNWLGQYPNLRSTGRQGLFSYNNLDHSIQMGLLSARHLQQAPDQSASWYIQSEQFEKYRIID